MKEAKETKTKGRRTFLSDLFKGGVIGLMSTGMLKAQPLSGDKIKLLTADGKLVEVDQSKIKSDTTVKGATNKEVMEWMNAKSKKA